MVNSVTTALVLDIRTIKKNNKYPIKLRVTYERRRKYFATGYDATKEEWIIINSSDVKGKLRTIRTKTDSILKEAEEHILSMPVFSFIKFNDSFFIKSQGILNYSVYEAYDSYIVELEHEGRLGNQSSFSCSKNSLQSFRKKLEFEEITPDFLKNYEIWMLGRQKSLTTVGFYLRALRTILNKAISDGLMQREDYPFGINKYLIPGGKKGKTALDLDDVSKIYHYQALLNSNEDRSKDFWLFSYMCNGMNFKDICNLKFNQIKEDRIIFIREKTKRTGREDPTIIEVVLTDPIRRIIEKWSNKDKLSNNYVFPIMNTGMDLKTQRKTLQQFIKTTNTWIKGIATKVGIHEKITTYVARHSYSYVMLNNGATIELISANLGHADIKTTQNYTSSGFKIDAKKKFDEILTSF